MASFPLLRMRRGHSFLCFHRAVYDSTVHNSRYSASKIGPKTIISCYSYQQIVLRILILLSLYIYWAFCVLLQFLFRAIQSAVLYSILVPPQPICSHDGTPILLILVLHITTAPVIAFLHTNVINNLGRLDLWSKIKKDTLWQLQTLFQVQSD
jgi:hypothetical protein